MKKLLFIFLFFLVTICNAQIKLESNKEGTYRVKEKTEEWIPSEITSDLEAIKYLDKFYQAIQNPGTAILVERNEKKLKLKLVFKKLVETEEQFIVYKEASNNIHFFTNVETKEESSYLILLSITSMFLMIISNALYKRRKDGAAAAFAFAVFLIAASAAFVAAFTAFGLFLIAASAAAFAFVAFVTDKDYKVTSIKFYILMALYIVLLFV